MVMVFPLLQQSLLDRSRVVREFWGLEKVREPLRRYPAPTLLYVPPIRVIMLGQSQRMLVRESSHLCYPFIYPVRAEIN
jgi:hypothetical protein